MLMATSKTTKMSKKKPSTPNAGYKKFLLSARQNWFLSLLVTLLCIAVLLVIVAQYKDWKNEKDLRELAGVFEILPSELEQALGVPFVVEKGCSQTQEKFNEGVFICDIQAINVSELVISFNQGQLKNLDFFSSIEKIENVSAYKINNQIGADCLISQNLRGNKNITVVCTPEIRKPNRQLAIELFSGQ
jgi:hypothetical protein